MILIVTEHAATLETLPPLVAAQGYPVATAHCGDEVVQRLRFRRSSLVILDCGVKDSFDMLSRIRSAPGIHATPVVMFSIDDENLREKALLRGADGYVPKGSLDWAEMILEIKRLAGAPTMPSGDA